MIWDGRIPCTVGPDRAQEDGGPNAVALDKKAEKIPACQCDLRRDFFSSQWLAEWGQT